MLLDEFKQALQDTHGQDVTCSVWLSNGGHNIHVSYKWRELFIVPCKLTKDYRDYIIEREQLSLIDYKLSVLINLIDF